MNVSLPVRRIAVCILIVAMAALCNFDAFAQNTTLWLVRHGEKSTDNPADRDPALSSAGLQRAEALAKLLDNKQIITIYSTHYKRTLCTAAPLATKLGLTPVVYNADDVGSFAQKAVAENKGKSALIIGHSNTLIPIVKALGASVPFDELNDKDYDLLFKVVIDEQGKAQLTISHFGNANHITEIPDNYIEHKP